MGVYDPILDLIKSKSHSEIALELLGSSNVKLIKAALHAANKQANGSYPIAHAHMKRSIDGKGNITHNASSKIATAIMQSKAMKELAKKHKGSVCLGKTKIFFTKDRDLARTLYVATIYGNLEVNGKTKTFKGELIDTYDFRFDLLPKKKTVKGWMLRYAGNAAYLAIELKLMKSYKIKVLLDGPVK